MRPSTTASGAMSPTAGGGKRACTILSANLGNSSALLFKSVSRRSLNRARPKTETIPPLRPSMGSLYARAHAPPWRLGIGLLPWHHHPNPSYQTQVQGLHHIIRIKRIRMLWNKVPCAFWDKLCGECECLFKKSWVYLNLHPGKEAGRFFVEAFVGHRRIIGVAVGA